MNYQTLYHFPILVAVEIKPCFQDLPGRRDLQRCATFQGSVYRPGGGGNWKKGLVASSKIKSTLHDIPRRSCLHQHQHRGDRHRVEGETQSLEGVEGVPHPREVEEQGSRTVAAAERRHTADNIGSSRRRNSGIHRRQRKGQHHSIGHTGRQGLRHCQLRHPDQLDWLMRRAIAGHDCRDRRDGHNHRTLRGHHRHGIGRHGLHDLRGIHHSRAVGGFPCVPRMPLGYSLEDLGRVVWLAALGSDPGHFMEWSVEFNGVRGKVTYATCKYMGSSLSRPVEFSIKPEFRPLIWTRQPVLA